jgi:hypothetical protein
MLQHKATFLKNNQTDIIFVNISPVLFGNASMAANALIITNKRYLINVNLNQY